MRSVSKEPVKKARERRCLDRARQLGVEFPDGDPVLSEEPDFVFGGKAGLGVEVTQLFHPQAEQPFSEREVEALRVWLLISADLAPLSNSFTVPSEIDSWTFRFDFDKVWLVSGDNGRAFDLARETGE